MKEEWKVIPEFPNYLASSLGAVRGTVRTATDSKGRVRPFGGKTLRTHPYRNGYLAVSLRKDGRTYLRGVHRLVATAFLGLCPQGYEVAHEDGCKNNNRIDNLRYDTRAGNLADMARHGTLRIGSNNPVHKLTESQVGDIRARLGKGESHEAIGRAFGVARGTITNISSGKTWGWLRTTNAMNKEVA